MPLWTHINILNYLTDIIDILIVTYVIYKVIMIIRGTKAVQLAKGILVIVAVWFLSSLFQLRTLEWILNNAITYGLFAIIVIFQPELRRLLEQLGRGRLFPEGLRLRKNISKWPMRLSRQHPIWLSGGSVPSCRLNARRD
ncbi:diadenylate cyclase spyDAC [Sporolactobacillus inulinus]|uniref:Diadenylate cyclase spyDAC n=1 Tax=Sporolactobacillus inulinus TaxID=2078 RepID=A0A4Y1ZGJ8_9BACL|nr:diadenylate cyclase spyDAC [Sporolactobacillus inulinus]